MDYGKEVLVDARHTAATRFSASARARGHGYAPRDTPGVKFALTVVLALVHVPETRPGHPAPSTAIAQTGSVESGEAGRTG
jgi:hypothetical protein